MPSSRRLVGVAVVVAALAFPLGVVASHRFSDVPDTNTFHADIDAIADVGVTTGCSATEYCPKDYVTREQMAAFLNRLGALGPGKTPVVNADRVDGYQAANLTRLAFNSTADAPDGSATVISTAINAPSRGWLLVEGTVDLWNGSSAAAVSCTATIGSTFVPGAAATTEMGPTHPFDHCHVQGAIKTCGGTSTVNLNVSADDDAFTDAANAVITVLYTPFNGTGNSPSLASCLPVDGGGN